MAEKKLYLGSVGPYLFDDTDPVDDADGDFPGETYHALISDRQIIITEAPTNDNHLMRYIDSMAGIVSYLIATGMSITIGDYKQIIVAEEYIIEGTGVLSIDEFGLLAIH